MLYDAHNHIGNWREGSIRDFEINFFKKYQYDLTFDGFLRFMDFHKIDKAVVAPTNLENNEELLKKCLDYQDKLYFFYWLNPNNRKSLEFLDKHENYIYGVKYHPSHNKMRIVNDKLTPFLKWIEKNDKVLLSHCGRWREMSHFSLTLEIARKFSFNVILAHLGGIGKEIRLEVIDAFKKEEFDNVYFETSFIDSTRDDFGCYPKLLNELVEIVGYKRILYASDWPFQNPDHILNCLNKLNLKDSEFDFIWYKNFERLLLNK
ncbi:MAG: amidohydrolase family protein [Promethearchaeota archaeon]